MEKKDSFKEALIGKRAMQGGVYNYLGEVKTVNAPIKWKSSAEHPIAFLSYITKEEMDILIKKNIYGSLKGKPNKGPFGLPSLQGSGSGSEGAGTSDSGSSSQAGDAGYSDYSDAGMGTPGPGAGAGQSSSGVSGGFDDFAAPTAQSIESFEDAYATQQALEDQADREKKPAMSRLQPVGIAAYNMSLANPTRSTTDKAMGFAMSPIGTTIATIADTQMRGVTAPDDYSQLTGSVQRGALNSIGSDGGGEKNIAGVNNNFFSNNLPDRKAYDMNLLNTAKSSFNYFDPYNYAKSNPLYKTFNKGGIINILLN